MIFYKIKILKCITLLLKRDITNSASHPKSIHIIKAHKGFKI